MEEEGCRRVRMVVLAAAATLVAHSCIATFAFAAALPDTTSTAPPATSKFIDPHDGWFDVSAFLDTGHGFVPVFVPITEPAVGYGLGGGLVFIRRNPALPSGEYRRPNMTVVGGMGTENGTWAAFAGHSGSWKDDRLQTLAGAVYGSINLDFYGIGDGPLNDHPVQYELEPIGGRVNARYRLGESRVHAGIGYGWASINVSFDDDAALSQVTPEELESRVAGLVPAIVFDSRDNNFTPTKGLYGELDAGIYAEALGGTSDFQRINLIGIYYRPAGDRVFLGVRGDATFSFNDTPFYMRPYISLRGAPVMRYLGENAASVELEARWQFWKRVSAVGFAGTGIAWVESDNFESEQSIVAGGGGFRYELARRYGLHMGFDVAWGPDETALYIQFGSAWFRP